MEKGVRSVIPNRLIFIAPEKFEQGHYTVVRKAIEMYKPDDVKLVYPDKLPRSRHIELTLPHLVIEKDVLAVDIAAVAYVHGGIAMSCDELPVSPIALKEVDFVANTSRSVIGAKAGDSLLHLKHFSAATNISDKFEKVSDSTTLMEAPVLPVTAIIPVCIDFPERYTNLNIILDYVKYHIKVEEIILVETSEQPMLLPLAKKYGAKYQFVYRPEDALFSKALAINTGLMHVKTKLTCVWDTDVLVRYTDFFKCVKEMEDTDLAFGIPYDSITYTNKTFNIASEDWASYQYDVCSEMDKFDPAALVQYGACTLFNTSALRRVKGFNELFYGWGHEDNEIVTRMSTLGLLSARNGVNPGVHLWHRKKKAYNSLHVESRNYGIFDKVESMSKEELTKFFGIAHASEYANLLNLRLDGADIEIPNIPRKAPVKTGILNDEPSLD